MYSCVVRRTDTGWMVEHDRGQHGPYHSMDIALRVATSEARTAQRGGRRAKVTVLDQSGNVKAEYPL
jgi:hypothetical protein